MCPFGLDPMGHAKPMNTTAAKELIPSRVSFPKPPAFDPTALLDDKTSAVYSDPISCGQSGRSETGEVAPKVQVGRSWSLYTRS